MTPPARTSSIKDLSPLHLVVVSPSDTVLGFHARVSSSSARERIENLKGRQGGFIVLVNSVDAALRLCKVSSAQQKVLAKYWPGPITFVLNSSDSTQGTLALRYPKDPFCLELIQTFGEPIISTSCNRHGEPTLPNIQEAMKVFGNEVDLYIEGEIKASRPSTLVDLTVTPYRILRQGETTFNEESS